MLAQTRVHVPRDPVRALTFDATEPRAVFARDALVSAARAIRELKNDLASATTSSSIGKNDYSGAC